MKPSYDAALREAVLIRMSPPNRESVTEIARDTGITPQTIYNWRSQWQKQGLQVLATTRPPEQGGALLTTVFFLIDRSRGTTATENLVRAQAQ